METTMKDLSAKTVLITGANRGIGRALAREYAAAGAHVLAVARHPANDPSGGPVEWIAADLSGPEGWARVIEAVAHSGRLLDILVNNAGIQQAIDLEATPAEAFREKAQTEIAINLAAPLCLAHGLIPHTRRPGGAIVNITSILSRHPKASAPVYCATKAGLASFTDAMRLQLAPHGIHVAEAIPPMVATDMTAGRGGGSKLSPEAMARAIVEGVARGSRRIAPGLSRGFLMIDRLAPEIAAAMMAKS
ncbi:MAG: short-chain dehydrogenase [Ahrensia sp.]|nr:short-chain dehydrogenase [Ahrensia sp.]